MARILLVYDRECPEGPGEAPSEDGHEVTTARDGEEALAAFSPSRFDILITDHRTPCMDGLELIKRVLMQAQGFPILVITGTSTDTPEGLLKADASTHLYKPISKADLHNTLKAVLSRGSQ